MLAMLVQRHRNCSSSWIANNVNIPWLQSYLLLRTTRASAWHTFSVGSLVGRYMVATMTLTLQWSNEMVNGS